MIRGFTPQVAYSSKAETYSIYGRVKATGTTPAAPKTGTPFTVAHTNASGVYVITFYDQPAEYLGSQVELEGTAAGSTALNVVASYSATANTLTVSVFDGTVATDSAFAFVATWTDNSGSP